MSGTSAGQRRLDGARKLDHVARVVNLVAQLHQRGAAARHHAGEVRQRMAARMLGIDDRVEAQIDGELLFGIGEAHEPTLARSTIVRLIQAVERIENADREACPAHARARPRPRPRCRSGSAPPRSRATASASTARAGAPPAPRRRSPSPSPWPSGDRRWRSWPCACRPPRCRGRRSGRPRVALLGRIAASAHAGSAGRRPARRIPRR